MLELGMTVRTDNQQVAWVMADVWVKMMYFKVSFAVPFFESEGTKLALPIVQFSEQNPNSGGYTLVVFGCTRRYPWTGSERRLLGNTQELLLG